MCLLNTSWRICIFLPSDSWPVVTSLSAMFSYCFLQTASPRLRSPRLPRCRQHALAPLHPATLLPMQLRLTKVVDLTQEIYTSHENDNLREACNGLLRTRVGPHLVIGVVDVEVQEGVQRAEQGGDAMTRGIVPPRPAHLSRRHGRRYDRGERVLVLRTDIARPRRCCRRWSARTRRIVERKGSPLPPVKHQLEDPCTLSACLHA